MKSVEIKKMRKRLGLTQQQMADELRVNRATIRAWEYGTNKPMPYQKKALIYMQKNGCHLMKTIEDIKEMVEGWETEYTVEASQLLNEIDDWLGRARTLIDKAGSVDD